MKSCFFSNLWHSASVFLCSSLLLSSCMEDGTDWTSDAEMITPSNGGGMNSGGMSNNTNGSSYSFSSTNLNSTVGSISDITTFDITVNTTALTETETVPSSSDDPNYSDDLLDDSEFTKTVNVTFMDGSVTYTTLDGVTFTQNGAHLIATSTKKVNFILSGTSSDGSFKLYSENKALVTLNDLTLTNPDGAALNFQTKKRIYVYATPGTSSTLADGTTYVTQYSTSTLTEPLLASGEEEDQKGVIFSEGQLIFCGSGKLVINATCKNGIASDQYVRSHAGANTYVEVATTGSNGIKGDAIYINGGVINVQNDATAGKGINSNGKTWITGGRTTLITSGSAETTTEDGVTSTSGASGLKSDSLLTISGGELYCKSTGSGGKGISTDMDCIISGGDVYCITTGTTFGTSSSSSGFGGSPGGGWGSNSSSSSSDTSSKPKAIKIDGNLYVKGGEVKVRCCASTSSGNEGHEGIEAKKTIQISGGMVASFSYDDAINSASQMTISGGKVFAYSINNDGIDSNAAMYIKGGWVIAIGTNTPENGIDTVEGTNCSISGGFLMAFSSTGMTQGFTASNGKVGSQTLSASSGATIGVTNGSTAMYFVAPRNFSCQFQYYMGGCSSYSVDTNASFSKGSIYPFYNFCATAE